MQLNDDGERPSLPRTVDMWVEMPSPSTPNDRFQSVRAPLTWIDEKQTSPI